MTNILVQQPIKWEQRQHLTLLEATVFWSGEFLQVLKVQYNLKSFS